MFIKAFEPLCLVCILPYVQVVVCIVSGLVGLAVAKMTHGLEVQCLIPTESLPNDDFREQKMKTCRLVSYRDANPGLQLSRENA